MALNLSAFNPIDYSFKLPEVTPVEKRMTDILTLSDLMDTSKEMKRKRAAEVEIRKIFSESEPEQDGTNISAGRPLYDALTGLYSPYNPRTPESFGPSIAAAPSAPAIASTIAQTPAIAPASTVMKNYIQGAPSGRAASVDIAPSINAGDEEKLAIIKARNLEEATNRVPEPEYMSHEAYFDQPALTKKDMFLNPSFPGPSAPILTASTAPAPITASVRPAGYVTPPDLEEAERAKKLFLESEAEKNLQKEVPVEEQVGAVGAYSDIPEIGLSKSDMSKYKKLLKVDPDYAEGWAGKKIEQNYKIWQMQKQSQDVEKERRLIGLKGLSLYAAGMATFLDPTSGMTMSSPEAKATHDALRDMVFQTTGTYAGIKPSVELGKGFESYASGVSGTYLDPIKKAELLGKQASLHKTGAETEGILEKNKIIAPESSAKILLEKAQAAKALAEAKKASEFKNKIATAPAETQKSLGKLDEVVRGLRAGPYIMAKQKIQRAEALEALINAYGADPKGWDQIDSRQIMEAAIAMQAMLSPGSASEHEVQAMIPKSAVGNAQKIREWLFNNPQGTLQGKFIQRIVGTIEREKATASNQVEREIYQKLALFPQLKNSPYIDDYLSSQGFDPAKYHNWIAKGMPAIQVVPKPEGQEGRQSKEESDAAALERLFPGKK
jgi:tetratricopeptide (TPR) repeat protein